MRAVVRAESLPSALAAAGVLAVMVNVVELLCTAGLPALYTQLLAEKRLSAWEHYAYLGLYNVAYMADDMIMVGIAVATLSRRKLQEKEGRWLKLLSGAIMVLLGLLLLFKPTWLAS
jgi:threonine/homoserine/homoserine lactone efflux protein